MNSILDTIPHGAAGESGDTHSYHQHVHNDNGASERDINNIISKSLLAIDWSQLETTEGETIVFEYHIVGNDEESTETEGLPVEPG